MLATPLLPQKRALRIWIAIAVIVFIAASAALLFWFTTRGLFSKNPRFTLKSVVVRSSGWWKDRSPEVSRILKVRPGETNLFGIRLDELRRAVESEPSIERASVSRLLPDTLVVEIAERIPRAFLNSPKSIWVVDGSGFVMARDTCLNLDNGLPVILGFRMTESLKPGMQLEKLAPGLELLSLTRTEFRDIRVAVVTLSSPDQIVFGMYYKNNLDDVFRVYMPRKDMKFMLKVLSASLEQIRATKDSRRTISLLYDGSVVLK